MSRHLTVLGSCGAWPEAGRASSGFLVEYDGFLVLVDLGYATLPRLLTHCPDGAVDAVVITHEHPDHCVDLSGLYRVRHYAPGRAHPAARIPLYCPPGVLDRVGQLEPRGDLSEVFSPHELPGDHRIGPFELTSASLPHHVPNAGVRLAAPGCVIAYTGDTGPDPALAALGRDADLFVMEATHQGAAPDGPRLLSTAREAGQWAAAAGASQLLLTHFWPGQDRSVSVTEAAEGFTGKVIAADEGLSVDLG